MLGDDAHNATALLERGAYEAAAAAFSQQLEQSPGDANALLGRGTARCGQGDFDAARTDLDAAVAHLPNRVEAWVNRGYCRFRMGDYQGALEDYNRAVELDPEHADARNNRGMVWKALGDLGRARADFAAAQARDPQHTLARRNLKRLSATRFATTSRATQSDAAAPALETAQHLRDHGLHARAVRAFTRVLRHDPGNTDARLGRADCLLASGHYDRAIIDFEACLAGQPEHVDALYGQAVCLLGMNEPARALESLAIPLARRPSDAAVSDLHGRILTALGRDSDAEAAFGRAEQAKSKPSPPAPVPAPPQEPARPAGRKPFWNFPFGRKQEPVAEERGQPVPPATPPQEDSGEEDALLATQYAEQAQSAARVSVQGAAAPFRERLGAYRLVRELGRGAMGIVYEGIQDGLERAVAIKVLPSQLLDTEHAVERFRREARSAATLNHQHIVTIYEIGEEDGWHYFSMELVRGETLEDRLKREGPLPPEALINYALQTISGLDHAWRAGIIHRDLKPSNLMVTSENLLKITDFGLAKMSAPGAFASGSGSVGTPHYMSPEQGHNASEVDFRADIYSLGATLYHLLTGQVPFPGESAIEVAIAVATQPCTPVCAVYPGAPPALAGVIERMMCKEPEGRYPDGASVREALEAARG